MSTANKKFRGGRPSSQGGRSGGEAKEQVPWTEKRKELISRGKGAPGKCGVRKRISNKRKDLLGKKEGWGAKGGKIAYYSSTSAAPFKLGVRVWRADGDENKKKVLDLEDQTFVLG